MKAGLLFAVISLSGGACADDPQQDAWNIVAGLDLSVPSSDTVAVVVVGPAACTVCSSSLNELRLWTMASQSRQFRLILTQAPNASEAAELARLRLPIYKTLRRGAVSSPGPFVFLVSQHELLADAFGQAGVLSIIDQLAGNALVGHPRS